MTPLAKNIKRFFSIKYLIIVFAAVLISVGTGIGVFFCLMKEVVIVDNGRQTAVKTMKTTVKEVLVQNGIRLDPEDYINLPVDAKLQMMKENVLLIKRAVPVKISVDGRVIEVKTYRDTVREVLENCAIKMVGKDRLDGLKQEDKVVSGMTIRIIRVNEKLVSEKIPIPFKVVSKENSSLDKGSKKIVKEGREGIREKLYRVVLENGREIGRTLIKDGIISNPIDRIVEIGTILNYKTARGEVIRYSKVLNMRATAYTASYSDTGKKPGDAGFGITYTGAKAKKGVIAVDPKVIPLGTRVYVEVAGNTPDYGYSVAADIGGAIKGDLIDLYFDDQKIIRSWGCKRVKVYILID